MAALKRIVIYACLAILLPFFSLFAEDSRCFFRDNDRWKILGDSITNNGTYVRIARRVLNHFHPNANIEINGIGVNGVASDYKFSAKDDNSTVVSIMLGTNNVIHHGYNKINKQKLLDAYRQMMLKKVKSYQAKGNTVLLFSSPPTDENFTRSFWELRNTNDVIREFPRILKEIAKETGAYYMPVQEEIEIYNDYLQNTVGIVRPLYPDGVHPNGWAQYQIARTLWEHLDFRGPLLKKGQKRRLSSAFKPVPIKVSLDTKFLEEDDSLKVHLQSLEPISIDLKWSYGNLRGSTSLDITSKGIDWTVPLKQKDLDLKPGQNKELVFDLASGTNRSLYILDITSTRVWHLDQENSIKGDVPLDSSSRHGTWKISRYQDGLLLTGTVIDDDIQDPGYCYSGRDGVHLILDLRQGPRFADLSFDEDVHFLCLNVQEKPQFGIGIVPVWGRGISFAGNGGAQKTTDGYEWHFFISHGFKDRDKKFDLEKSDFIGFNIDIVDIDLGKDGKCSQDWIKFTKTDYPVQNFPTFVQIIDMKNKLKSSKIKVLNLWGF